MQKIEGRLLRPFVLTGLHARGRAASKQRRHWGTAGRARHHSTGAGRGGAEPHSEDEGMADHTRTGEEELACVGKLGRTAGQS